MKISKEILKQIKKYDSIVIARHIGADPDALGSQFALKEIIEINFPINKYMPLALFLQDLDLWEN